MNGKNVVIADNSPEKINAILERAARLNLNSIGTIEELATGSSYPRAPFKKVEAVLTGVTSPDPEAAEALMAISEFYAAPVIVLAEDNLKAVSELTQISCIFGIANLSTHDAGLTTMMEIAMVQYSHRKSTLERSRFLENTLNIRKEVERATGVLLDRFNISSGRAYKVVQEVSIRSGQPVKLAAEGIVLWSQGRLKKCDDPSLRETIELVTLSLAKEEGLDIKQLEKLNSAHKKFEKKKRQKSDNYGKRTKRAAA